MPGPPPKPADQRRRRNADPIPRKTLTEPPAEYPPLPNASNYTSATRKWYRTWATSPQAARFQATDWQRLAMLAPLVEQYHLLIGDPTLAPRISRVTLFEAIARAESGLGATEADRLRLRWDVQEPKAKQKPPASSAGDSERAEQVMRLIQGGQAS